MNEDSLDLGDDFDEGESSSTSSQSNVDICNNTRRRLEERLDAVRVKKQTEDYDFDLD